MNKLYIVGLPIGNIKDITVRAIEVLKLCDLILCEDTREFIKIAKTYDISTKTKSFHDFNERDQTNSVIDLLKLGKNIALVSDRGMPTISDPGFFLIKEYINYIEYKFKICNKEDVNNLNLCNYIECIPGVSAVTTSFTLCNFSNKFVFWGFLEEKDIKKVEKIELPTIFFEAPHRINNLLKILYKNLGKRRILICRELTKMYQEVFYSYLSKDLLIEEPKGEFTLIIEGFLKESECDDSLIKQILKKNINISDRDLMEILLEIFPNISKKKIYNSIIHFKNKN